MVLARFEMEMLTHKNAVDMMGTVSFEAFYSWWSTTGGRPQSSAVLSIPPWTTPIILKASTGK